ncbi:pyridoxal phosphate-dependent aminotransferase [Halomarina salina]|uniref:Pyridoxal phosphate-dependent aminotransferase n=1 Tax=Halomarina salina TaxID=1872699 RepID=A0ABD5RM78_9EURY|nr:pyridoxal phosphate-dependent aminotransferase [Halomarina salina]
MTGFSSIDYLEWIAGRPERATHDLASSDLRPDGPSAGVVPPSLDGLPDPEGVTLEGQLADVYDCSTGNVQVTAGASHANALVAATFAEGRVLVESPGYEPLVACPEAFGARVERFDRPDGNLDPTLVGEALDDANDADDGNDVSAVVVTNRHNPTGKLADRETLAAVADRVAAHDALLVVDEVYASYDPEADDGPFGGPTAAGLPNTLAIGSLTKFLGLGDLRIGWVVGPTDRIERLATAAWYFPVVAGPSRALARRALANRDALADHARDLCARNHDLLAEAVAASFDGEVPDGSPYALVGHPDHDGDELAARAAEEGVLVVPGRFFERPDAVRVSLGGHPDEMREALAAFAASVE